MNVTAHQEKKKNEETKTSKKKQEKKEDKRQILKKLYAALLQSFRRQHGEKTKGSACANWDPREGQQSL